MSTPTTTPWSSGSATRSATTTSRSSSLLNKRLSLVDKLWRYKAEHGLDMYVPQREQWMVKFLSDANEGPLSDEALGEIYKPIVETSKARPRGSAQG